MEEAAAREVPSCCPWFCIQFCTWVCPIMLLTIPLHDALPSLHRTTLGEEYKKQVLIVLSQFESDLAKAKEEEEGLRELMRQSEKAFQQRRMAQTQRMKTIRKLHEQYMQGMQELDSAHQGQQAAMQSELKKEMALLQKKILMETVSELLPLSLT